MVPSFPEIVLVAQSPDPERTQIGHGG
jgi:hypothetical protein